MQRRCRIGTLPTSRHEPDRRSAAGRFWPFLGWLKGLRWRFGLFRAAAVATGEKSGQAHDYKKGPSEESHGVHDLPEKGIRKKRRIWADWLRQPHRPSNRSMSFEVEAASEITCAITTRTNRSGRKSSAETSARRSRVGIQPNRRINPRWPCRAWHRSLRRHRKPSHLRLS